jgi:hypothetical protein
LTILTGLGAIANAKNYFKPDLTFKVLEDHVALSQTDDQGLNNCKKNALN